MQEGVTGVKRGQSECEENPCNGKLRRREGIKRGLQDITPVSYEEYNTSWDLEDQSKKCRRALNCLLASCKCKVSSKPIRNESGDMLVHLLPDADGEVQPALIPDPSSSNTGRYSETAAVLSIAVTAASSNHTTDLVSQLQSKTRSIQSSQSSDRQPGRIAALPVQPGLDSTSAVQSNLISPATSQSTRDTRRRNRAWGSSLFRIGVMLLFMFLSLTVTEGVKDWSESPPQTTRNQGVRSIRECYVPNTRDTRLVSVHRKNAISMGDDLLQHAEARGPNVRCIFTDQHGIIGYAE